MRTESRNRVIRWRTLRTASVATPFFLRRAVVHRSRHLRRNRSKQQPARGLPARLDAFPPPRRRYSGASFHLFSTSDLLA